MPIAQIRLDNQRAQWDSALRVLKSATASVQQLISLILIPLLLLTTAPPVRAQSTGTPTLAGSVVGLSSPAIGIWEVDLQLTNNGGATAQNITLTTLQLRTLAGSGTVTYDTTRAPALPLTEGNLATGSNLVVRLYFNVPATVLRFSITENGNLQDPAGTSLNFSLGQAVLPTVGLISVQPNAGQQGQNLPVTITGRNTHFTQGVTAASFGPGVTIQSLAVASLTSATAVLSIDPAAALGGRNVTMTTGTETVT